jgi:hypothetical protein
MSFSGKWMELKITILREINQTHKDKNTCCLSYMECRYININKQINKKVELNGGPCERAVEKRNRDSGGR